jgi:hypothetical protein
MCAIHATVTYGFSGLSTGNSAFAGNSDGRRRGIIDSGA